MWSSICLCGHPYDLHYGSPTGERDEPCLADCSSGLLPTFSVIVCNGINNL